MKLKCHSVCRSYSKWVQRSDKCLQAVINRTYRLVSRLEGLEDERYFRFVDVHGHSSDKYCDEVREELL